MGLSPVAERGGAKTYMTASMFVDTNLFVYAYDLSEPDKQRQARILLRAIVDSNVGAISTQVLVEFANIVIRKIPVPLRASEVYTQLEDLLRSWMVLEITPEIVLEAVRGMRDYGFSIWDGQIWATARLNGISVVLSEDFNSGATIEGVKFLNPFLSGFDAKAIIPT